jgi:predicted nicotinamide N-methyase
VSPEEFVRANTRIASPPLVPELRLHLATEITPIWEATEASLERSGVPPPFWAFPWVGGQALARFLLDDPAPVRGRRVLDFGAGSGLVAIAAARAGASATTAAEIDAYAAAAIRLNAALNDAAVEIVIADLIGSAGRWDTILCGDMCYERPLAERLTAWLDALARGGAVVLLGDPGRSYFPQRRVRELAHYSVPTTRELEDREMRETGVWRLG